MKTFFFFATQGLEPAGINFGLCFTKHASSLSYNGWELEVND